MTDAFVEISATTRLETERKMKRTWFEETDNWYKSTFSLFVNQSSWRQVIWRLFIFSNHGKTTRWSSKTLFIKNWACNANIENDSEDFWAGWFSVFQFRTENCFNSHVIFISNPDFSFVFFPHSFHSSMFRWVHNYMYIIAAEFECLKVLLPSSGGFMLTCK